MLAAHPKVVTSETFPLSMSENKDSPSSNARLVDYIHENFIKGGAAQGGSNPGFNHAMKLSYHTIEKKRLSVEGPPKSLTYRYRLSSDVPKYTVGLFTALMDELSTNACFRVGLPSAPGVSLQMQTELVDGANLSELKEGDEVDVINVVVKLGRTVSHTRTEFIDCQTGELIGFSSHIKYMPTGSRLFDLVFNNPTLYSLYERLHLRNAKISYFDHKPLFTDVIQSHLEFHGLGHATFHVTREHTNAFGTMHGGCHAMVMEAAAETFAKAKCEKSVTLQAIHIDFLGAAKGSIDVVCESIPRDITTKTEEKRQPSAMVHVRVLLKKGDKIYSEGKLRYVVESLGSRL